VSQPLENMDSAQKRALLAALMVKKARGQYPAMKSNHYFNFGAQGILSKVAQETIRTSYEELMEEVPFTVDHQVKAFETMTNCATALATELGVERKYLSLVENTTTGCNTALWGMNWQAGDHLLYTDCEYPAVVAVIRQLEQRFGISSESWPIGGHRQMILDGLDQRIGPRTRMVVLSHIPWNTGTILPLAEISALCKDRSGGRIRVVVDGAQSAGVLDLNMEALGVDAYAFPGHKWLCGPEGTGCLYVSPRAHEDICPTFFGPRGCRYSTDGDVLGPQPDGRRYESSSTAVPLYRGLAAALGLHHKWGSPAKRFERITELSGYLWKELARLEQGNLGLTRLQTKAPEAGLVYVGHAQSTRLSRELERSRVMVRTIPGGGCIRICTHYLTLREEIDHLLKTLSEACQKVIDRA